MGRFDRRAWRGGGIAAGLMTLAAILALGGAAGAAARGQEITALVPERGGAYAALPPGHAADSTSGEVFSTGGSVSSSEAAGLSTGEAASAERPPRRRPGGGERMDVELRRRLADEERRAKEVSDEVREEALLRLYRECGELPPPSIRLGPGDDSSPSAAFLRAVSPIYSERSPVERRGFDRIAERELRRAWRRELGKDMDRRRLTRGGPFADLEISDETSALYRALDDASTARWSGRFPAYWEGHPAAVPAVPRIEGERIELIRLGAVSLDNELDLRYDLASLLSGDPERPLSEEGAGVAAPALGPEAAERRRHVRAPEQASPPPRGNLAAGSFWALDARVHLATGLSSAGTGFVRSVRADLDCTFFSSYDGTRYMGVGLETDYDPAANEQTVALMVEVLRF